MQSFTRLPNTMPAASMHVVSTLLAPALLASSLLASGAAAQLTVAPPNFSVELIADGIEATGDSLAIDRFGNAYLTDGDAAVGTSIIQVRPNGTVVDDYATGFSSLGQLAYHPLEGVVYAVETTPVQPVILTTVHRLNPNGGLPVSFTVNVVADGFTIAGDGSFFFGGTGLQGPGLYRLDPPLVGISNTPTFLGTGFGTNSLLEALPSGDVLIANGLDVKRWSPGAADLTDFYSYPPPFPNAFASIVGLGQGPMNQLGSGAMVGVREFGTFCLCGTSTAVSTGPLGDLVTQTSAPFASEPYLSSTAGATAIATGIDQQLYWLTRVSTPGTIGAPGGPLALYRIDQEPAINSQGSLFAGATAATASFDLYGPTAGGDPFVLSVAPLPIVAFPPTFLPPWGLVDLVPGFPGVITVLDGVGLGGPPEPLCGDPRRRRLQRQLPDRAGARRHHVPGRSPDSLRHRAQRFLLHQQRDELPCSVGRRETRLDPSPPVRTSMAEHDPSRCGIVLGHQASPC